MHLPAELTGAMAAAPESEVQLLAALLDGNDGWIPALRRILPHAEAWVDRERRCLWDTLLEMHDRGETISGDSVAVRLRRMGLEDVRSAMVLLLSRHSIFKLDGAEWHAQQIAYAYERRLLASVAEMAGQADIGPQEMTAALREKADQLERIAHSTGQDAPRPLPMGGALLPVKPFNTAWLPEPFRPWIEDIAERMQCPPEFPAVAAMAALSSVAGRRFCIQPKTLDEGYTEFPHLWAMLIGNPSLMKSPAMQAAMRPLHDLEDEAHKNFGEMERDRKAAEIAAQMKRNALQISARKATLKGEPFDYASLIEDDEGSTSPCRRFIVNDPSLEALGEVLKDNPTGTLFYQDELAGLLALLEKDGNQSMRAFLLQAWSGKEGFTFDRIGRGRRRIKACVLSLLGSIQPGVIAAHVRGASGHGAGADGFLQRFSLMVWPDVNPHWENIDRPLDRDAEFAASATFLAFENLKPEDLIARGVQPGRDGIPTFRFAPDAQDVFTDWRSQLEHRLRSGSLPAPFEAHLGKYRKLVPALALLIHTAEDLSGQVTLSALRRAIAFADCLESHAARVFASGTVAESTAVHTLLRKLCDGTAGLPSEFKARDIRRKCWAGLSHQEEVESACELLVEHRWLIATTHVSGAQGVKTTTKYHLNPLAKKSADVQG